MLQRHNLIYSFQQLLRYHFPQAIGKIYVPNQSQHDKEGAWTLAHLCIPHLLISVPAALSLVSAELGLTHPWALSLCRLLQLQVMPLSHLHLRHFRRVQMCLVLYLSALLLYPQVSPFHQLPFFGFCSPRERQGWLSQPPDNAKTPMEPPFSPATLRWRWEAAIQVGDGGEVQSSDT